MNSKFFKKFFLLISLIFFISLNSDVVIWDLGDTLITQSTRKSLAILGKRDVTRFYFRNLIEGKSGSFFRRLFNFKDDMKSFYLDTLSKMPSPYYKKLNYEMKDSSGKVLPPIMQDFMIGRISAAEVIKIGEKWMEKNKDHFPSENHMRIFSNVFHLNFDPELFMSCNCYTTHFPLLKKVYNQRDRHGNKKNVCIILSNWAKEWIPLLKTQFPEIFEYSDVQVFSCNEGCAKPCPDIYKKCLSLYPERKNERWLLFDDQDENRNAAERLNIKAFHPNKAEKTLRHFGLI